MRAASPGPRPAPKITRVRGSQLSRRLTRRRRLLSAFFGAAGLLHFIVPQAYEPLVPEALPGSTRVWVVASGIAELACAVAIGVSRTRQWGARAAVVLLVLVFPANVKMAVDWYDDGLARRVVSLARLPLQLPLVLWARRVIRDEDAASLAEPDEQRSVAGGV